MEKVTCWVCREEYRTGDREPLVLPCGHTYCRQCILSLARDRIVGCPTCRRNYYSLNVDKLPKNFAILSLAMNENMVKFADIDNSNYNSFEYVSFWMKVSPIFSCIV